MLKEKVLGFKEKDGRKASFRKGDDLFVDDWAIEESKLVPVVSLEWLKKYCKENKLNMTSGFLDVSNLEDLLKACNPNESWHEVISVKDLLLAIKK